MRELWGELPLARWLEAGTPTTELPIVAAMRDETDSLIAFGALLEHDMEDRLDLDPWLGCLYVDLEHRNHGIARAAVRYLLSVARGLGISTLYLFCADYLMSFYASEGWTEIERCVYEGRPVTIMGREET